MGFRGGGVNLTPLPSVSRFSSTPAGIGLNSEFVPAGSLAGLLGKINSCNKCLGNICNIMSGCAQHVLGIYVKEFGWNTKVRFNFHAKKELQFFKNYI